MDLATHEAAALTDDSGRIQVFRSNQSPQLVEALHKDLEEGGYLLCVVGSGPTELSNLLQQIRQDCPRNLIGVVDEPTAGRLLYDVAAALGIPTLEDEESVLRRRLCLALASNYQKSERLLLLIDHADRLQPVDLRLLQHLFSGSFAQIVLIGAPSLLLLFEDRPRELEIRTPNARYQLDPCRWQDVRLYIRQRLIQRRLPVELFSADAIDAIFLYSAGSLELVNRLFVAALARIEDSGVGAVDDRVIHALARQAGPTAFPHMRTLKTGSTSQPVMPAAEAVSAPPSLLQDNEPVADAPESNSQQAAPPSVSPSEPRRMISPVWRDAALIALVALAAFLFQDELVDLSQRLPAVAASFKSSAEPVVATQPKNATSSSADFAALHTDTDKGAETRSIPPVATPAVPNDSSAEPRIDVPLIAVPTEIGSPENDTLPGPESPARQSKQEVELSPGQLIEVARLYAGRAEYEMRKGDLEDAMQSVEHGLQADPNNQRLRELRRQLRLLRIEEEVLQAPVTPQDGSITDSESTSLDLF